MQSFCVLSYHIILYFFKVSSENTLFELLSLGCFFFFESSLSDSRAPPSLSKMSNYNVWFAKQRKLKKQI